MSGAAHQKSFLRRTHCGCTAPNKYQPRERALMLIPTDAAKDTYWQSPWFLAFHSLNAYGSLPRRGQSQHRFREQERGARPVERTMMFAITTIALAAPTRRSIEMQTRHQRFYREPRRQWIRQHSNTIEAELAVSSIVTMRPLNK